jgi:phytoene dehydrogenase-like protein
VDVASPLDLETDLRMPGGNIFHGDLSWPWLDDDEPAETAAERYGVAVSGSRRILLAGAGSRRGGGVSGLGGAAAVDALLAGERTGWKKFGHRFDSPRGAL